MKLTTREVISYEVISFLGFNEGGKTRTHYKVRKHIEKKFLWIKYCDQYEYIQDQSGFGDRIFSEFRFAKKLANKLNNEINKETK